MSALDNMPTDLNFFSGANFQIYIKRAPYVNYFSQSVKIPSVSLPPAMQSTLYATLKQTGDKIQFDDTFGIEFKLDEKWNNYLEIYRWMTALGHATSSRGHIVLDKHPHWTDESISSQITVAILNGSFNPVMQFVFDDCYPVYLSGPLMTTENSSVQYASSIAAFAYSTYKIIPFSGA